MLSEKGERLRLDKFLSDSTNYSRKDIKRLAKNGQIRINGVLVTDSSAYVFPENDKVTVTGEEIVYKKFVYLMMYKPQGVLTATEDSHGKPTFADYIGNDYKFYHVGAAGRLDIDAEGFLLLSNDGAFIHEIITPNRHVEKKYYCKIKGKLKENSEEAFKKGIKLEDGYVCMEAKLEILSVNGNYYFTDEKGNTQSDTMTEANVTVCEGHFHQVKRMVAACGGKVVFLKRYSIGGVLLDEKLLPGQYRELTEDEIEKLKLGRVL